MRRYLPYIIVSLILIGILTAVNRGFKALFEAMGPGFVDGFLFGCAFCVGAYLLAIWLDPASRPRGNRPSADD